MDFPRDEYYFVNIPLQIKLHFVLNIAAKMKHYIGFNTAN
jgi:hypothetical protein